MQYIRDFYGVPAKRGGVVRPKNDKKHTGVIIGSKGPYLRVKYRMSGNVGEWEWTGTYHPDDLEYQVDGKWNAAQNGAKG